MQKLLEQILIFCLDTLLPKRCVMCGDCIQGESCLKQIRKSKICGECFHKLTFISKPACGKCAASLPVIGADCLSCYGKSFAFDCAKAALVYDEFSKKMIMRFKHNYQTQYASLFGAWMYGCMDDEKKGKDYDGIIPVPLHPFRLFKRGYNQSAYLAQAIQREGFSVPILFNALKRTRNTQAQGQKTPTERDQNVAAAFIGNASIVKDKALLLVDDVMTTGASLHHCTLALKEAGAKSVDVLVLARAQKDSI